MFHLLRGSVGQHKIFIEKQTQLGVLNSRIQVELGLILQAGTCPILNFAQNQSQKQSVQGREGGTSHAFCEQGGNREGGGNRTYFLNGGQ